MLYFRKILRIAVIFLGGVIAGMVLFQWKQASLLKKRPPVSSDHHAQSETIQSKKILSDFSFIDRSGKTIHRADLLGKVWIADFIFTRCMGPCPLLTSAMAKLQDEFKDKKDFRLVSFTVDPDYDTPPVLAKYAEPFKADKDRWFFLHGPKDNVYQLIQQSFHLAVAPDETDPMQVVHSLSFVLVGKEGEILGYFNSTDPEALAELRKQLKELL